MAILKKNIWLIFKLLIVIAILLSVTVGYFTWERVNTKFKDQNTFSTQLIREAMVSVMQQQETILDVLGDKLLDSEFETEASRRRFLDRLLLVDNNIAGFGLSDNSGQLLITSSNLKQDNAQLPNLMLNPLTKRSFERALKKSRMVIGLPYFMSVLNTSILPVRKRLTNAANETTGVMTAGIKLSEDNQLFGRFSLNGYSRVTVLSTYLKVPLIQQSNWIEEADITGLENKFTWFFELPNQTESNIVSHVFTSMTESKNRSVLVSYIHVPTYDFTVVLETETHAIYAEIIKQLLPLLCVILIACILMFFLVRHVDQENVTVLERVKHQAETDMLTGIPNRYGLLSYAEQRNSNDPYSALFIDLTKFKNLNDSLGHKAGDGALKAIAKRIEKTLIDGDMLVRFGGDEFLVMTADIDQKKLQDKASRIIKSIEAPLQLGNTHVELWANIGIATHPRDGLDVMDVVSAADLAMYEAKQNTVPLYFFDQSIKHAHMEMVLIENDIVEALKNDHFYLVYQPQFDAELKIIGIEALVRWKHNERGLVPPDEFISIAERRGLMPILGTRVIELAIRDIRKISAEINQAITLSINVSVSQFSSPDFASSLIKQLAHIDGVETNIVLEVTESLFIGDPVEVNRTLKEIKQEGIHISLDDFGTGYSSLSLLRDLDIDELKIDRSFISPIEDGKAATSVVKSVIDIGHTLGMFVLAEGVENKTQLTILQAINCDRFQGFLFAKPMKIDRLIDYVNNYKPSDIH
jgi:diguanylate cyclase (GGDEF)-like protein